MKRVLLPSILLVGLCLLMSTSLLQGFGGPRLNDDLPIAKADTIPAPGQRYGDFITDPADNPFDLNDPAAVEQTIEYDAESGQYIVTERIGEFYFRPPTYLTFDEYMEYRQKQEETAYFQKLAGVSGDGEISATDPFAKLDLDINTSMLDRLFGGTEVDIQPQGGIDLTFGYNYNYLDNPSLPIRQRRNLLFDFDMAIQMNVTGKIGEKLTLTTNYNTNATFNFDNQIKLDYNSDLYGEDDILKKIEAGNVSLPLRGELIQGAQSLFGLKTELQFGHLRLTAIASQQNSENERLTIEGGAQVQEFEVRADDYDENRHFFLSHYNRAAFEGALTNLPQINSLFKIQNVEVWITNDRNEVEEVRNIIALADLAEPEVFVDPATQAAFGLPSPRYREICDGRPLPDNRANSLYAAIQDNPMIEDIDQAVNLLQAAPFNLVQSRDFEKVQARKLRDSEYTFHPDLGFISVNINVQPDQVLAVSYEYQYNGNTFVVGEPASFTAAAAVDTTEPPKVMFLKMLKSTTQRVSDPTWDLMMKNVYSIGAFNVNSEDFRLDIFYDDPGQGYKRFLPASNLMGVPLIDVFNLDELNAQRDPQPDGVFDFVPGLTIYPRNGRIMFPVLEPFGSSLKNLLDTPYDTIYPYQELYDETIFQAQEFPEKNRFVIKGEFKTDVSSEISLGSFNLPQGSVQVTAGGRRLDENVDYEVDYSTGRLRILNDAILASGAPINVTFEDNTLFGLQRKTMVGLRADYQIDENTNFGATFMQLFERPFTQKVNYGDDPINNRIYGFDFNMNRETPWLTKALDKLPLYSTNAPSSFSLSAEAAYLDPGHSRLINLDKEDKRGIVYVDDFEGSASSIDLRQPTTSWYLASVPQDPLAGNPRFPESSEPGLVSGANRAKLSWYRIDPSSRRPEDESNPYTARIPQQEVFPNLQTPLSQNQNIQTLDLTFQPTKRGPYNFDTPDGFPGFTAGVSTDGDSLRLLDPASRWGGVMREIITNDFQSSNIEFLEFWMMSPFMNPEDPNLPSPTATGQQGTLYIDLGNISEDILKDSRKAFENGLPSPTNQQSRVDETVWGLVPLTQQITNGFDNSSGNADRVAQDVGLDGLNDQGERVKFSSYLDAFNAFPILKAQISADPSADNFLFFNDPTFTPQDDLFTRYENFNNTEGNSQANTGSQIRQTGTDRPDAEDINQDNTLNENESYFEYDIPLVSDPSNPREILIDEDPNDPTVEGTPYITDRLEADNGRIWYRFRIPLDQPNNPHVRRVGGIEDFRSIRFMRMYMQGFQSQTTLRFARLDLVRNQWRRYRQPLDTISTPDCVDDQITFDVDAVNIEENSSRMPFNYVLPIGIQREQVVGNISNVLQNEQSIAMRIDGLCDGASKAIFRRTDNDMRLYERLQMFVHAEATDMTQNIETGDLTIFMRLGSDFRNNYYEYEIPLRMSDIAAAGGNPSTDLYKNEVWRPENQFDIPLELLKNLKVRRNDTGQDRSDIYSETLMPDPDNPGIIHTAKVRGNPNLGYVKLIMIGVRNTSGGNTALLDTEVWLNELRLTGLEESGGFAGIARMDMQLADLGSISAAGNFSTKNFGALDDRVHERSREDVKGYDLATQLALDKFLPEELGLSIPFYAQHSKTVVTPEYDPYDLDLTLDERINAIDDPVVRDSVREQALEVETLTTYNFTNVRKNRTNTQRKPTPIDLSNFSFNYGYTKTTRTDPIIESDEEVRRTGGIDYAYTLKGKPIEPFKKIKSKHLKLLSNFNFNPLPSNLSFSTLLDRRFATTRYRFTGVSEEFSVFHNKQFVWDRNYSLKWDLTKSLRINYNASANAIIDEPKEDLSVENFDRIRRDSIWTNIRNLGRAKNFEQGINVSYTLPLRYLPYMDWVSVKAQYRGGYNWAAAPLNIDSLGNVIQNNQGRQLSVDLNFEKLYNHSKFLKKINRPQRRRGRTSGRNRTPADDEKKGANKEEEKTERKKRGDEISQSTRALVRPLLLVRKLRLTYAEDFRTSIPGFMPAPELLGLSSGFEAPGWGFVAGLQPKIRTLSESEWYGPNDWLHNNRSWISDNVFQNQEVFQDYTQRFDASLSLEPFQDFRIDIDLRRNFTENHSQVFKDTVKDATSDLIHAIPTYNGSLTVSYAVLKNLFKDGKDDLVQLFSDFEDARSIISQRLGQGVHEDPILAAQGYTNGYGNIQQDVLIPAFLSVYTNQDPNTVDTDIFNTAPRPNWRLTYNGLSRIPAMQEIFQNFNLSHGYQSSLNVNNYQTTLYFLEFGSQLNSEGNFYPRLEIPGITIQEAFSPLLAIDATLVNGMSFNAEFTKQRTLAMSFINQQLNESHSKELVLGFGYLLRGVDIPFLTGSRKKGGRRGGRTQPPGDNNNNNQNRRNNRGGQLQGQDLDIQFSFSLRDDITFAHNLDQGSTKPTRGTYDLSFSPSAEYQLNRRLALRLFFDYRRTAPKMSGAYARTSSAGGVVVRFKLD